MKTDRAKKFTKSREHDADEIDTESSISSIWSALKDDDYFIPYRPKLARMTGRVSSAILLQQIIYRWKGKGADFFKFKSPCSHRLYKAGDSWTEEVGLSPNELNTALKSIATKITTGKSKNSVLAEKCAIFDENGKLSNAQSLVIYWTDSNRLTWYKLNEALLQDALSQLSAEDLDLTHNIEVSESQYDYWGLGKEENHGYPDIPNFDGCLDNPDFGQSQINLEFSDTSYRTKKTTENTNTEIQPEREAPASHYSPVISFDSWEDFSRTESGLMFDALCFVCHFNPESISDSKRKKVQRVVQSLTAQRRDYRMILKWSVYWFTTDFRGESGSPPTPEQVQDEWSKVINESYIIEPYPVEAIAPEYHRLWQLWPDELK